MHIVAVAIIGRANRYDRLQSRRASSRDLKGVESTPGDSHHSDRASAPGLRGKPRYDFERVILFLLRVLVRR